MFQLLTGFWSISIRVFSRKLEYIALSHENRTLGPISASKKMWLRFASNIYEQRRSKAFVLLFPVGYLDIGEVGGGVACVVWNGVGG